MAKNNENSGNNLMDYIRMMHQTDLFKFTILHLDHNKIARFISMLRIASPKFSDHLKTNHADNIHLLLVYHACTIIINNIQKALKYLDQKIPYQEIENQVMI